MQILKSCSRAKVVDRPVLLQDYSFSGISSTMMSLSLGILSNAFLVRVGSLIYLTPQESYIFSSSSLDLMP